MYTKNRNRGGQESYPGGVYVFLNAGFGRTKNVGGGPYKIFWYVVTTKIKTRLRSVNEPQKYIGGGGLDK